MGTEAIEQFLRTAYTDERLAMLLAHAEDGKLSMYSCCCLRGVPSADHALQGSFVGTDTVTSPGQHESHYQLNLQNEYAAELEFYDLAEHKGDHYAEDADRRAKLIPLVRAEMKRRDSLRAVQQEVYTYA